MLKRKSRGDSKSLYRSHYRTCFLHDFVEHLEGTLLPYVEPWISQIHILQKEKLKSGFNKYRKILQEVHFTS